MNETNLPKPLVAHANMLHLWIFAGVVAMMVVGSTWIILVLAQRDIQYVLLILPLGFCMLFGPSFSRAYKAVYQYSNFAPKPIPYIALDKRTLTLLGTKLDWTNIRSIKLATIPGRAPIRFLMIQLVGDVSELGFPPDVLDRLTRSNELVIERLSLPYNEHSRVLLTLAVGSLTVAPSEIEHTSQGFLQAAHDAASQSHT